MNKPTEKSRDSHRSFWAELAQDVTSTLLQDKMAFCGRGKMGFFSLSSVFGIFSGGPP